MESDFYMEEFLDDFDKKTILLVKQLTLKCPGGDPRHNCPFSALRDLTLKEKLEAVDVMSSNELEELVQEHYDCFDEKGINRHYGGHCFLKLDEILLVSPAITGGNNMNVFLSGWD